MKPRLSSSVRLRGSLLAAVSLVAAATFIPFGSSAGAAPARAAEPATVLQTNLVSDLPGLAPVTDPNLVNPWGITESSTSPFWISDNNAGVATLYTGSASIVPLVVSIPTPVGGGGGAPTGTVFNGAGAFVITKGTASGSSVFLFATEDGTIAGWSPGVDRTHALIAVNNSGNNFTNPDPDQQTGAVYKGLAIATTGTPIITKDPNSKSLLYASNFRAGTVEVYDGTFQKPTGLAAGAFTDPELPDGYAPFNVQVLGGKVYVTYARQNATKHDDLTGPHRGFVDVFNLDGRPGLPGNTVRLISRGPLDSPWGLAIAPQNFAGLSAPGNDPVLLVGNFGNGHINAFDATTGSRLGQLKDPDGEPIRVDGLWALKVGNNAAGGNSQTVYFTSGPFGESHGLFGSLTSVAPGTPEGPAESQWVQANVDVVQLDQQRLATDSSSGASAAIIRQDTQTLDRDSRTLAHAQRAFAEDTTDDTAIGRG